MSTSAIPISKTKVVVPARRRDLLTRPRLLDILADLLEKKLMLISAPAGYGKTSLLIDLVDHSEMPFCWLSLDELDQEPQRFISYFIASLTEQFPDISKEPVLLLNDLTSFEQDLERLLVAVTNEIFEHVSEHFVIALDDFHLVDDSPVIQKFINRFVQLVGENCHVVISSRVLISLPDLPLLVARDQVGGLDFVELAFRADEIQALLAQNYQINVSRETAKQLAEETEGWITGLQLSGNTLVQGMIDQLRVARASGVDLFEYLGQQVLGQQTETVQAFLLRSSLLDEFNADLCEAVLGPSFPKSQNWNQLIKTVLENNLFTQMVGANGQWIRYHHLFRDFLRNRLNQEFPKEVDQLRLRLAQYYEKHEDWEKAYHFYQQLGDVEMLASLVERSGTTMLQRALLTLENWLLALPPSLVKARPGLLSLQGSIAYMKGQVHEGLDILSQAEQMYRDETNVPGLSSTLVRKAIASRYLGNYQISLDEADEAICLTESIDELQQVYAEAQRVKGLSLNRLGKPRQAIVCLEKSLRLYQLLQEAGSIPILLMEIGVVYQAMGRYQEAQDSYQKALDIWQEEGNLTWQSNVLNNMGVLYHSLGKYEKAVLTLEKGLACARKSNYTRMEALILTSLGDLYTELDEYEGASETYRQANEIALHISDQFLINYLTLAQANLAILTNRLEEALEQLAEAQPKIQQNNSQYELGLLQLKKGQLAIRNGNYSQAITNLQGAEDRFSQDEQDLENRWSQLWLAVAYSQNGEYQLARDSLQKILTNGRLLHSIYVNLRQARPWLHKMMEDPEAGRKLKQAFTRVEQLDEEIPSTRRRLRRLTNAITLSTPRISIQALGKVQVLLNGKPISLSEWQTQSVRDMFFFFLHNQSAVTKEQLGEIFWPDIDEPAKLKLRFKNDIYRLRRAVSQDIVVFENDKYSFNRSLDYEYDVDAFLTHLEQAHATQSLSERITHLQKAVELFRGPYLADIDATWAWPEREHLDQTYLSSATELAELYLQQSKPAQTLEICQRILEYDSCFEQAYRLAMRAHANMGNRPEVVRQYQACKEILQEELDLPPSAETEMLYRQLTA
jgi:LuxR family maltose regulon positive regulatory protein